MAGHLLKFTSLDPAPPKKRGAKIRVRDFDEVYAPFSKKAADAQASRCSQCGVPFCQSGCPLENNIPDWLQLAADGRTQEAYDASAATNPMPEICGRICPQDRLCEAACVIEKSGHGAVTIGGVEKHLTDTAWKNGWVAPIAVGADTGRSVGVIGAGPAGLAAAERLRGYGHSVTVYDRHDRTGGLLVYGIPNFKLDKDVVARRATRLEEAGVIFQHNADIGGDTSGAMSFADVRQRHDAVVIAIGVYAARALPTPGADADGVVAAMDFLTAANREGLGDAPDPAAPRADDRQVIVIGGGDTAMDCVRTAVRQGAASVTCLYRRDKANMPGSAREVVAAEEEGVHFEWLAAPKEIRAGNGAVSGVSAARMRLGPPDASGRQAPEETPDSAFELPADLVIAALGFDPEDAPRLFDAPELAINHWGAVKVTPFARQPGLDIGAGQTSLDDVFAAGDIVRGASLVVWALRDGLDVADQVDAWLAKSGVHGEQGASS